MKPSIIVKTFPLVAAWVLLSHGAISAQELPRNRVHLAGLLPGEASPAEGNGEPAPQSYGGEPNQASISDPAGPAGKADASEGPFYENIYGGADFLFLRVHFSEAIGFVQLTQSQVGSTASQQAQASELNFDYHPSVRGFLGYQLNENTALQFTYWFFDNDTTLSGNVGQANQSLVDPFGNTAALGQGIQATASVKMNVYDLDFVKGVDWQAWSSGVQVAVGVRIADIDQKYDSLLLSSAGGVLTRGDFQVTYVGAGPHLELEGHSWFGDQRRFSLVAKAGTALLVGGYDVSSGVTLPGINASQSASRTLMNPVLEAELGGTWRPIPALTLSAGWLFQAWFDLGTSGGNFGGKFVEVDDSNIMSFDGLFIRGELKF